MNEFNKIDCPGCQADADARQLLWHVELIGNEHGIEPARMLRALSVLAGLFGGIAAEYAKGAELSRDEADARVREVLADVEGSLRHYLAPGSPGDLRKSGIVWRHREH